MPQGYQTDPETQWAIVWFSGFVDDEWIAMGLNLSTCTVKRVLAHYRAYGTIPNPKRNEEEEEEDGAGKGHLHDVDVEVMA